jgi:hypothetical protein
MKDIPAKAADVPCPRCGGKITREEVGHMLGKLGAGVKRTLTKEDRQRRKDLLAIARGSRWGH